MSGLTLLLLLLPELLHLAIFSTFDLGVDEAHYVLYGRHLDWSYFDHPPLVGWVHAAFDFVFGETLLSARLPAILIGFFCVWQVFRFLRGQGYAERVAAWCAFAAGVCFQFFVLHLFFLPDTLLLALIWPLMSAAIRVSEKNSARDWLWLGLWLGLAGLSKYTAVLLVIPVAAVILPRLGLSFLRGIGFYLGVGLAGALIAPVIVWNFHHEWASLQYQAAHVMGGESGFGNFVKSLAAQFGLYSPFLFFFAWIGLAVLWRRSNIYASFAFWVALPNLLFFLWSGWRSPVLPHWPALFYLFAIPSGLAHVMEHKSLFAKIPIWLTGGVVAILAVLLVSGQGYAIPQALKEVSGWPDFMREVAARASGPKDGIAVLNWTYGSRALYYARESEAKVFVLDNRFDQFDLWIVQFSYDEKNLGEFVGCESLGPKERIPVVKRGFAQYEVILQKCTNAKPPL